MFRVLTVNVSPAPVEKATHLSLNPNHMCEESTDEHKLQLETPLEKIASALISGQSFRRELFIPVLTSFAVWESTQTHTYTQTCVCVCVCAVSLSHRSVEQRWSSDVADSDPRAATVQASSALTHPDTCWEVNNSEVKAHTLTHTHAHSVPGSLWKPDLF